MDERNQRRKGRKVNCSRALYRENGKKKMVRTRLFGRTSFVRGLIAIERSSLILRYLDRENFEAGTATK